jgi:hypothetical protein
MPHFFESAGSPLFAAEFDYFRLPPEKWTLMLARLHQMGINALDISLPWSFHEFEPGSLDLNGATHPRRNLQGLLRLCTAMNFVCLLNPGPYSDRGVLGHGIPLWLSDQIDPPEASLHPAAEGWLKAVGQTLAPHQWPHGPVAAMALNTQPPPGQPIPLSKQLTEVRWRIWLRKQYQDIETLNAAYRGSYTSVNQVQFPASWATGDTPLDRDARAFLEHVRSDTQTRYRQNLQEGGWQGPIYEGPAPTGPDLPALPRLLPNELLAGPDKLPHPLVLRCPLEIDPDPADVGRQPAWAVGAPIGADGSPRPAFWRIRQTLWAHTVKDHHREGSLFWFESGSVTMLTCAGDAPLKVAVSAGSKALVYRLRLNGHLAADPALKVQRNRLTSSCLAADESNPTDLLLLTPAPAGPLTGSPLAYLAGLLAAQAQTLITAAALAAHLGQTFTPTADAPAPASAPKAAPPGPLADARRGLAQADAALRKAANAIGGLEAGFAAILDKPAETMPQPAPVPAAIVWEIFEGQTRALLLETGTGCAALGPPLTAAAAELEAVVNTPGGFSLNQYQQAHQAAAASAQTARTALLALIDSWRHALNTPEFPLLLWRVHNQLQDLAQTLRWGIGKE